jgi:hypothetical protein
MPLRLLLALAATALLVPAAVATAAQPGIVQSANYPADEAQVTSGLGARWVRLFFRWDEAEPGAGGACQRREDVIQNFERRVNAYRLAGINVLAAVMYSSPCANAGAGMTVGPDPHRYAAFMEFMARRFAGRVGAWEIWNEPDETVFWHRGPDPVAYAALLEAAYPAIKRADPLATVVTGGMTGNNYAFLEQLYRTGAQGSFDAVAVHTDTACLIRSPDFYYRERDGRIGRFSFTGYREVYRTMQANGDAAKTIWVTEMGWSTLTSRCRHPGVKERRASGVSQASQAKFLEQAFACMAADPFVSHALWFSLRDAGTGSSYDQHLGLQSHDGSPKAAFNTFRRLFAGGGNGPPANGGCGAKVDGDVPAVTIEVPVRYFNRFVVSGRASDPTTTVSRIELWVDGRRMSGANQKGGRYRRDWFGSTKLRPGGHRIELRAYDEALNVGVAAATVTRLTASSGVREADARVSLSARRAGARRIAVRARVKRATTGEFTEPPRGRLIVHFDQRRGKRWKAVSRYTKGISKPIRMTYTARAGGRWRVWGELKVDPPYRRARTTPVVVGL